MNRILLRLSVIVVILLIVVPAKAQSKSVEVPRRDAEITILPNGDVQVVETWNVKFSGGPFTSAFLTISLSKVDAVTEWSIAEGELVYHAGHEIPNSLETSGNCAEATARWYFSETHDQTRTFTVRYTLKGTLWIRPAKDQLYWMFIEAKRDYPIQSARVIVHLPPGLRADQIETATESNSKQGPGARTVNTQTLAFTGGPFPGGKYWAIGLVFPHGIVDADLSRWQQPHPACNPPRPPPAWWEYVGIAILLAGATGFAVLLAKLFPNLGGGGDFGGGSDGGSSGGGDGGGSSGFS